jgi:hypothetical protein
MAKALLGFAQNLLEFTIKSKFPVFRGSFQFHKTGQIGDYFATKMDFRSHS